MKQTLYTVRFHLGKGQHFKHWQIRGTDGSVRYYDPGRHTLEMSGCRLINKLKRAEKVHREGVKDVCGWVLCESVRIDPSDLAEAPIDNLERLFYNPIVEPYWRRDGDYGEFVWDNYCFSSLVTNSNKVYVLEERS